MIECGALVANAREQDVVYAVQIIAYDVGTAAFFLRRATRPNAPRPETNSTTPAGSGVAIAAGASSTHVGAPISNAPWNTVPP